ncbi:MAG: nickel pincer cofactor biosynthesis protein LarB [Deltaproteobacteria bacterium]|nr:nickel pincer cofactor biosynthesis protein LarB [Deltaproteobacteria bacterium]
MKDILKRLARGELSVDEAERLLKGLSIAEVADLAKLDVNREIRKGFPEIVLAEGKRPKDIAKIASNMVEKNGRAIVSRLDADHVKVLQSMKNEDIVVEVYERARIAILRRADHRVERNPGKVGVLTAGTSDIPVAEEARIIAEEMGCTVFSSYDTGVSGIHRLFPPLTEMINNDVDIIVVIAGREGALPTVVSGLVDIPIIAVPTSIGYGYGGKGVSALMSMLQACSLGIAVVNIDGGVAAGSMAALIARRAHRGEDPPSKTVHHL